MSFAIIELISICNFVDETRETDSVGRDERSSRKEEQSGSDNRKLAYFRWKGIKTDKPCDAAVLLAARKSTNVVRR